MVKLIDFWHAAVLGGSLYPRALMKEIDLQSKEVIDLVGPRRSGKSSIFKLLIKNLPSGASWLYINFEDPFFVDANSPRIIEQLIDVYHGYFSKTLRYLFFDEIQNIKQWETAIRKLRDSGKYKVFVTGSSSKLLSGELASLLSGRHLSYQVWPLSFAEYLNFQGLPVLSQKDLILKETVLIKHFDAYLKEGGFPEAVLTHNQTLVRQYYEDIVQLDIVKRYAIREKEALEKMGIFLMSNSAKIVSVSSLKKLYNLSFAAAANYLSYFQEAFLCFTVPAFSYSLKTQQKSFKKIYVVDTGLAANVSFKFSEDKGRMLENIVFLGLKRWGRDIYYFKTANSEVDFLVIDKKGKKQLIQVAWDIEDAATRQRETKGLDQARKQAPNATGLILTYQTRTVVKDAEGKSVPVMPVWEWLLSDSPEV